MQGGQRHKKDAIPKTLPARIGRKMGKGCSNFDAQAGLAHPTRPGKGQQAHTRPRIAEQIAHCGQFLLAADEGGKLGWQVVARRAGRGGGYRERRGRGRRRDNRKTGTHGRLVGLDGLGQRFQAHLLL